MAYTRCDACRQIVEMEDKVYENAEKEEETRRSICWQASEIPAEEKENVDDVQ